MRRSRKPKAKPPVMRRPKVRHDRYIMLDGKTGQFYYSDDGRAWVEVVIPRPWSFA